jgi:hypothetical protein
MMRNIVSFIVLIVLVVILSGAKIERAPGSVSRPPVPTYGYVVFTIPLQRQGTDEEDQFALWLETAEGQHFKTLAVTDYAAIKGLKDRTHTLPVWEEQSRTGDFTQTQFRDVNAMTISTPDSGLRQYIWYCDNDAGTKAMKPGKYRYLLESTVAGKDHVVYVGEIEIGTQSSASHGLQVAVAGVENPMVAGISARFVPSPGNTTLFLFQKPEEVLPH